MKYFYIVSLLFLFFQKTTVNENLSCETIGGMWMFENLTCEKKNLTVNFDGQYALFLNCTSEEVVWITEEGHPDKLNQGQYQKGDFELDGENISMELRTKAVPGGATGKDLIRNFQLKREGQKLKVIEREEYECDKVIASYRKATDEETERIFWIAKRQKRFKENEKHVPF